MTPTDAELIEYLRTIQYSYPDNMRERIATAADRLAALVEENERLSLIIGAQAKKMHRWKPALERYADEKNWEYCEQPGFGEAVLFTAAWDGPSIARAALQEPNDAN